MAAFLALGSGESAGVSGSVGLGDFFTAVFALNVSLGLGDFFAADGFSTAGDLEAAAFFAGDFLLSGDFSAAFGDLEATFFAGNLTTILDGTSGSDSSLLLATYLCFLQL